MVGNMAAKFQPANQSPPFSYTMTDQHGSIHPLDKAEAEKDLGVWIDNRLTFSVHVAKSAAKANSLLDLIHRSFKYLDKDSLPLIYKAIIRLHIKYANSVWWPLTKALQSELKKVQHRATKMVTAIKDLPYEERLFQLNLPSVTFRHMRGDMINMLKR